MFQLDVVTLFPEIFHSSLDKGVIGRAIKNNLVKFRSWNPRDFTKDKHKTVDARPYGGGPGMVIRPDVIEKAVLLQKNAYFSILTIFAEN